MAEAMNLSMLTGSLSEAADELRGGRIQDWPGDAGERFSGGE